MKPVVPLLLLGLFAWADEVPAGTIRTIPKLSHFTNVVVTDLNDRQVSFRHDDGIATVPLALFDDDALELLIPGHRAKLQAKEEEAAARQRTRDAQRKQALEQDPVAAAREKQKDNIREAALRNFLAELQPGDLKDVSAISIRVEYGDPSIELLARFAAHRPPVMKFPPPPRLNRPYSQNEAPQPAPSRDIQCDIGEVKWRSDTEVTTSTFRGDLRCANGSGRTVDLRLTGQGWKVMERDRRVAP